MKFMMKFKVKILSRLTTSFGQGSFLPQNNMLTRPRQNASGWRTAQPGGNEVNPSLLFCWVPA